MVKRIRTKRAAIVIVLAVALTVASGFWLRTPSGDASGATRGFQSVDTKKIDQILGRSGELRGDVYKVGLPRTDLKVTADGVAIKPALALGSWIAFNLPAATPWLWVTSCFLKVRSTPCCPSCKKTALRSLRFTITCSMSSRG